MLEIPDEIHHQIGEASVNAEVHVCFSRSLIPDFNVDWIFLIESVLEEKRLEEIQQGSPLTEEEDVYYRTTYVESNIQSNGPSEGFKLLELFDDAEVPHWVAIHTSGGGMYYDEEVVGAFSTFDEAEKYLNKIYLIPNSW